MHRIAFVVVAMALALVPASSPARAAPLAQNCIFLIQGSTVFRIPLTGSDWIAGFPIGTRYFSPVSDGFTFDGVTGKGKMTDASIGLALTSNASVPAAGTAQASFTIGQKGTFKLKDSVNGVRISIKGVPTVAACPV